MRRLMAWAALALATLLWAAPAAAQTCTNPGPRMVVSGGGAYVVRANGDSVSAHTSVWAAAAAATRAWAADTAAVVWIDPPTGRIRVEGCRPSGGTVPPPLPPPPPPPPAMPWTLTTVSATPIVADSSRWIMRVALRRGDGSPVTGQRVRWRVIGGAGGFGGALSPTDSSVTDASGEAAAGWVVTPGVVNTIAVTADSADALTLTRTLGGATGLLVTVSDSLRVDFSWPSLGADSVYVALFGGIPMATLVQVLAPGTTSGRWSLPYHASSAVVGDGWFTKACFATLAEAQTGHVNCLEHVHTVAGTPTP